MRILIAKAILSPEQLQAVTKNMSNLANEMKHDISIDFLDLRVNVGEVTPTDIEDLWKDAEKEMIDTQTEE